MTLQITPETGVPVDKRAPKIDLKDRAAACAKTISLLSTHGLDVDITDEDRDTAAALAVSYAADPDKTSKAVTDKRAAKLTPAVIQQTHGILDEFGRSVVDSAVTVRHLVTNKLILETENPDPRVRIKALELLGKISDVGLFAEKSEVTITHQTTDDLKEKLRKKLQKLTEPVEHVEDAVVIDADFIDVDKELGVVDE
tara:strand:+ start:276 stop:869 length:594 start_codon:yes stop_codon:yes gene_type:complete